MDNTVEVKMHVFENVLVFSLSLFFTLHKQNVMIMFSSMISDDPKSTLGLETRVIPQLTGNVLTFFKSYINVLKVTFMGHF